jgi:hypothetical protein
MQIGTARKNGQPSREIGMSTEYPSDADTAAQGDVPLVYGSKSNTIAGMPRINSISRISYLLLSVLLIDSDIPQTLFHSLQHSGSLACANKGRCHRFCASG